MGSFDMACAISGISLGSGQPTKMFFIANTYDSGSSCYPTDQYKFCSFGIDMEYYDYGDYEFDTEQVQWKEFIRFIQQNALPIEQGENQYHDHAFDPKNPAHLEPKYLFSVMNENRLILRGWGCSHPTKMTVHPFPIHKRVFDEVCLKPHETWRGDLVTVDTVCDADRRRLAEKIERINIRMKERYDAELMAGKITQDQYDDYVSHIVEDYGDISSSLMRLDESLYPIYDLYTYHKENGETVFWRAISELQMMFHFLYVNRIMVVPTMSAGQEHFCEDNIAFHQGCVDIATDLMTAYNEEYE